MFVCESCGATAPADPETGYDGDNLCSACAEAEHNWTQECSDAYDDDDPEWPYE